MEDGVHGMLYPAAYPVGSQHRRDVYYAARALDNTSYVVFANAVDGVDPWRCNGGAAIYEPEGRALVKGPDTGDSVQVASLTADRLAYTRERHTMLAERPTPMWAAPIRPRRQVWT
jgi:predicted amidohydrolase